MNAFLVASMAIGVGAMILGVNKVSLWFTAGIFAASVSTMVGIVITERRKAAAKPSNKIDYTKLAATNLAPYAGWLKEHVRGHDQVIDEIVNSIQEELPMTRPGRIIGAYIVAGPTGTGKTFLGQLLASCLYPDSEVVQISLNQLKHSDDVFTLIGPPPGRPGFEVGGVLTRPVLQNPYRVIILDEIDTCHPDLHHCLYDILDTGRGREKSSGKTVDFSGCVFYATTNAGIEQLRSVSDVTDFNQRSTKTRDALFDTGKFTKPFLARWNRILLMDELQPIHVAEVALLQVCHYWKDYGVEVSYVPPELLLEAVERNEEFRAYGVRQLSTFIRQRTNQAISQARAAKMSKVHLDVSPEGNLVIKPLG
jgi:ATP-dependent Clp protease ATP-binding subunit ClpC